jgi:hypothetical protein
MMLLHCLDVLQHMADFKIDVVGINVVEYQSAIGTNIDVDFYFQQSPQ